MPPLELPLIVGREAALLALGGGWPDMATKTHEVEEVGKSKIGTLEACNHVVTGHVNSDKRASPTLA